MVKKHGILGSQQLRDQQKKKYLAKETKSQWFENQDRKLHGNQGELEKGALLFFFKELVCAKTLC